MKEKINKSIYYIKNVFDLNENIDGCLLSPIDCFAFDS